MHNTLFEFDIGYDYETWGPWLLNSRNKMRVQRHQRKLLGQLWNLTVTQADYGLKRQYPLLYPLSFVVLKGTRMRVRVFHFLISYNGEHTRHLDSLELGPRIIFCRPIVFEHTVNPVHTPYWLWTVNVKTVADETVLLSKFSNSIKRSAGIYPWQTFQSRRSKRLCVHHCVHTAWASFSRCFL